MLKMKLSLSWSIGLGTVYDKNQMRQRCDQFIGQVYVKIETKLSRPIWVGTLYDEN